MFYKVVAKCGHVRKSKYMLKSFYVKAKNKKEAAFKIKYAPRVKHDNKDVIREIEEITFEEYRKGIQLMQNDGFFNVHNSSEQRKLKDYVDWPIFDESVVEISKTRNPIFKLKKYKLELKDANSMIRSVIYG